MSQDGFFMINETDMGSKARAKKACDELPASITKETRWQLRAWWERVLATARLLCPIDTGTLMSTIRIQERMAAMTEGYPFEVVYTPKNEIISSEIVAGGLMVNPKTGRICDYAQAVHDGHFTRSGRWIPPQPFIQDAINIHINELEHIINRALDKSINTVWIGE